MNTPSFLIFDFDGTVALGDGPVLAYARAAAGKSADPASFVERVQDRLHEAADGDEPVLDGYDLVRRASLAAGLDDADLATAYRESRALLGTAEAAITSPAGLAEFLHDAALAGAVRILFTNAPGVRLPEALAALGLADGFDRIIPDAGKPEGLDALLETLPQDARVLSIGDIWHNDLAPAHRRGHDTALIGSYAVADAAPTFRSDTFEDLLPQLRNWLHKTSTKG